MFDLSEKEKQNAMNEVRILASINHPNVIRYKEAFMDKDNTHLCLVIEFADDKDLYQKLSRRGVKDEYYDEDDVWYIFLQLLKGLKALHDLRIMHRDLKSANVFMNKDLTVKLGDMNVSRVAESNGLNYTQTGTPYYASPEVWKDQPYNFKNDIWALGCVLYEITCLKPPFKAPDMQQLYEKVMKGQYPRIPKTYSRDLAIVIKSMLQVKPKYRPTVDQLFDHDIIKTRLKELNLEDPVDDQTEIPQEIENLNNNFSSELPIADYTLEKNKENGIIFTSESVQKEPTKSTNINTDDYDVSPMHIIHQSINHSIDPHHLSTNTKNLTNKKSIQEVLASHKLLSSLTKHNK